MLNRGWLFQLALPFSVQKKESYMQPSRAALPWNYPYESNLDITTLYILDRAHICPKYHKLYLWRKNFPCGRISAFYAGVLSMFGPFLFEIYVEENLCGENLCGEKMTNMRSVLAELEFGQLLKMYQHCGKLVWCCHRCENLRME